jgi:hypothetical protein
MNRRNFIKSAAVASVAFPTIVSAIKPIEKPERVWTEGDMIEIVPLDWLRICGIRAEYYSANCVDKNGRFAHERGFQDLWLRDSEPFVVQSFRLQCMKKIYSKNPDDAKSVVKKIRLPSSEFYVQTIIDEIKEKMEYVSMVAYALCPCLCGRSSCPKYFIPIVSGLSKYRYNLYLKQLNDGI